MGFEEDLISLDCEGVLGNKRDRRRGDDDWSIWPSGIGILYSRETHSLATAEREWADFIIKIKFAQNTTQQMPRQPRYFIGCRLEKHSGEYWKDSDFYWGTVDGFRLLAIRKEWLGEDFKKYYDQSDGEWFVTECLCAGMELRYG